MRKLIFVLPVLILLGYRAHARTDPRTSVVDAITAEAKRECGLPGKIHPYSEGLLRRFASQWVYHDDRMLTLAFLRGFSWPNSDYIAPGYCVAAFMNVPIDPGWEGDFDPLRAAQEHGVVPGKRLTEVRPDGRLVYEEIAPG